MNPHTNSKSDCPTIARALHFLPQQWSGYLLYFMKDLVHRQQSSTTNMSTSDKNNKIKNKLSVYVLVCVCSSACEGGDLRGDRGTPLLQQKQDRGTIADCQVLLFTRAGCRDDQSCPVMRGGYGMCLFIFSSQILFIFFFFFF